MKVGVVEVFEVLYTDDFDNPIWFKLKFEGDETEYALHVNWTRAYGELKPGDLCEYEPAASSLKGETVTEGRKKKVKVYTLLNKLRRKEASEDKTGDKPILEETARPNQRR